MSEPTHPPSPGPPGKGTINVPGIGKLPTLAVVAGVGVVLVLIVRNRSSSSSAGSATPADPAASTGVTDPGTGGTGGITDTSVSGQVTSGPPFTSNAAWSQYAVSVLASNGYDPGTLTGELGDYLAGQPVTATQETDINAAVAVAGYPPVAGPNGYPPAINVSGSKSGGSGSSSGSGSGSGSPGSPGSWQYPAPQNLAARAAGKGKIAVSWAPVVGPQGQRPSTYTVAYGHTSGAQTWHDTAAGTSITLTTAAGATEYIEVWANGGPVAPPHAGPIKATAGK